LVYYKTNKQHTEILNKICLNIQNEDKEVKKAAIIALGFICEILFKNNITELEK